MYMHYLCHGAAAQIAGSLRAALATSKTPLEKPAPPAPEPTTPPQWVKIANDTIGRQGTLRGGVLSFGLARSQEITEKDRKSTRLNSSHTVISYAVFCLKKKKKQK